MKELCNIIKTRFENYNVPFGERFYNSIKSATNNFYDNLTFYDLENKVEEKYLDYLIQQYCISNKNIFLIIVWPVTYNHENIINKTYNKYGKIIFKKEISLEKNGFKNILHFISDKRKHIWGENLWFAKPHRYINPLSIYLFEVNQNINTDISVMRNYLIKIFRNNKNHIKKIENRGGLYNLFFTTIAKRECRINLAKNNCVKEVKGLQDRNYSHHVNDEHYETIELSRIFFNKNSIFAINNCNIYYKCKSFDDKYSRYSKFINNNKLGDINDFCLNNSSILCQFGLRQSRDIDYLHNTNFNIDKQIPEEQISSHNYVVKSVNKNININELVYDPNNYFWYKNIKFLTLDKLLEFKKQQTTEKAKKDVNLCESIILNKLKFNKNKLIQLNDIPQNILTKYLKNNEYKTNQKSIDEKEILFETDNRKKYSHYRIIFQNNGFIYKLINFYDTCLPEFLSQVKYDIFFKKAIELNFYENISLVKNFIYNKINNQYIGYCSIKMNEIKIYEEEKFINLVERLIIQYEKTGLIFTDLTINTKYKSNIMEYNNKYYIIDLESVCDKDTYLKYRKLRFNNNNEYYESRLFN